MTWLRIDDCFEDNGKVAVLSDAAHRLWMRASCWSAKRENLHTEGFIPEALLEFISRNPSKSKRAKLVNELVNATIGGTKDCGLWVRVEGGYMIHDWDQYRPKDDTLSKSEASSIAGKRSAEARRERSGTAQPVKPTSRTDAGRSEVRSTERDSAVRGPFDRTDSRTARTPDPEPVPEPAPQPLERTEREITPRSTSVRPNEPSNEPLERTLSTGSNVKATKAERKHLNNLAASFLPTKDPTAFPAQFEASPENAAFAASHGLALPTEVDKLRSHMLSTGKISCAWQEELKLWLRRSVEYRKKQGGGTRQPDLAQTGWE